MLPRLCFLYAKQVLRKVEGEIHLPPDVDLQPLADFLINLSSRRTLCTQHVGKGKVGAVKAVGRKLEAAIRASKN
jgi:hypothetical protein